MILQTFFFVLFLLLPERALQSNVPNPGKHTQPVSEHWPFPPHRSGHLRTSTACWCSSHPPASSSSSLFSHSFSSSGIVALSQDLSSFSCRSETHMATARRSVCSPSRPLQLLAGSDSATARRHWASARCRVRPEGVGHAGGVSGCAAGSWSSGKK